jgi:hypothetical protein
MAEESMESDKRKPGRSLAHWGEPVWLWAVCMMAAGLTQWVCYVLLGMAGVFDVVGTPAGRPVVIEVFPFARVLVCVVLGTLIGLGMVGAALWRRPRVLKVIAAAGITVAILYVTSFDSEVIDGVKETAQWYRAARQ